MSKRFVVGRWIFWLIIIPALIDIGLAGYSIITQRHNLESNPVYMLTGGFGWVILANIIYFVALYYVCFKYLPKAKPAWSYFFVSCAVWSSLARLLGIIQSIRVLNLPASTIQQLSTTTSETAKINAYAYLSLLILVLPILLSMITYYIFTKTYKITPKSNP